VLSVTSLKIKRCSCIPILQVLLSVAFQTISASRQRLHLAKYFCSTALTSPLAAAASLTPMSNVSNSKTAVPRPWGTLTSAQRPRQTWHLGRYSQNYQLLPPFLPVQGAAAPGTCVGAGGCSLPWHVPSHARCSRRNAGCFPAEHLAIARNMLNPPAMLGMKKEIRRVK